MKTTEQRVKESLYPPKEYPCLYTKSKEYLIRAYKEYREAIGSSDIVGTIQLGTANQLQTTHTITIEQRYYYPQRGYITCTTYT